MSDSDEKKWDEQCLDKALQECNDIDKAEGQKLRKSLLQSKNLDAAPLSKPATKKIAQYLIAQLKGDDNESQ